MDKRGVGIDDRNTRLPESGSRIKINHVCGYGNIRLEFVVNACLVVDPENWYKPNLQLCIMS